MVSIVLSRVRTALNLQHTYVCMCYLNMNVCAFACVCVCVLHIYKYVFILVSMDRLPDKSVESVTTIYLCFVWCHEAQFLSCMLLYKAINITAYNCF